MYTKSSQLDALVRLADRIPSMLAYWDSDLRCRFANRAYERWFGVDPKALIGTSLRDLLGPALFALNEPHVLAALEGRAQSFERLVPGPDGVQRHSQAHYIPDVVDGEVQGFMVEVTEVTRLKNTELALRAEIAARERAIELLRQSEAALQRAQHLGQLGSWELEAGTGIVRWSDELYRIFGCDPTRLPPSYDAQAALFTPASWAMLRAAVDQALATGLPYQLEVKYIGPDGQEGWMECRGEVILDEHDDVVGLQGVAQVTTERHRGRQADRERKIGDTDRRHRVQIVSSASAQIRTALTCTLGLANLIGRKPASDLLPDWLRMIEEASMEILEALTIIEENILAAAQQGPGGAPDSGERDGLTFPSGENEALALVVHELRNLLAPIKNGLGVLGFSIRHTDVVDRTLDVLERQTDHMARLTDDLLNVSRMTSGAFELVHARVTLDNVVAEAVAISRPVINKAQHELILRLPDTVVWLDVDPLRIVQVLSNLLINAAKFTPTAGRIELSAHQEADELVILVSDNGRGLSVDAQDSVFDLFDQGAPATTNSLRTAGFGIGLTLVRRLVALHGGRVSATSAGPGQGSTFMVRLPCVAGSNAPG